MRNYFAQGVFLHIVAMMRDYLAHLVEDLRSRGCHQ